MSFSEEQVRKLQSLADAFKDTAIEEIVKQAVNTSSSEDATKKSKAVLEDLEDVRAEVGTVKGLIGQHIGNYVRREDDGHRSTYLPNAAKMFYVLNIMDTHISDNYYARRAMPNFFVTTSRTFFANLWIYAILLVSDYENKLSADDSSFLTELKKHCPPEKMPIPGPIVPFFKAINTSVPSLKHVKNVIPALPRAYPQLPDVTTGRLSELTLAQRFMNQNYIDWAIPFTPYILQLHTQLLRDLDHNTDVRIATFGALDSGASGAGFKEITYAAATDAQLKKFPLSQDPRIVEMIRFTRAPTVRGSFPFPARDGTRAEVVNGYTGTANDFLNYSVFGNSVDGLWTNTAAATARQNLTKLGINEPIEVHKDLVTQFIENEGRSPIPVLSSNHATTFQYTSVAEVMHLNEDFSWYNKLAAEMGLYCRFWPDSGTLADCKITGPRVSQYRIDYETPTTLPIEPTRFADPASNYGFDNRITTYIQDEEVLVEAIARYVCINPRMYATHPWITQAMTDGSRTGQVWDIRPQYSNGTVDHGYTQTTETIKNMLIEKPLPTKSNK